MIGLGTIINCGSVLAGASAGMLLKNGLSKRFEDTIMQGIGLCTMFIGIGGALSERQRFLGFGNFCIDGGRRTYLQVAYVSFYRGPVGVVNFIPDNDTGCGKVGGSSFVEVKLYIIPRLFAAKFNFFCFPGR